MSGAIVVCSAVLLLLTGLAVLMGGRSPQGHGSGGRGGAAGDADGAGPWAGSDGDPSRGCGSGD
ncbi:hypothetical protein LUX01_11275 [Streptomyces sudanensis]|uniref:hypothetical protein n=1 Tax=Streptomyces sudanensis TaxID=436397 RepID=UPI0020CD32D8|nr:hypothetical protein [Streptomyces sudanensis]MCP9987184.1 hypothetical protein [Streptomyces sudanensis]